MNDCTMYSYIATLLISTSYKYSFNSLIIVTMMWTYPASKFGQMYNLALLFIAVNKVIIQSIHEIVKTTNGTEVCNCLYKIRHKRHVCIK